jgi:hypothetical protein
MSSHVVECTLAPLRPGMDNDKTSRADPVDGCTGVFGRGTSFSARRVSPFHAMSVKAKMPDHRSHID